MFPEHVFKERQEFAEKIANAPVEYLQNNAAALLRIVWELQNSLALELQVIQGVKRLDVTDVPAVSHYLDRFSDYVDRRDFNLERTSCGRIAQIYWDQIRVLEVAPGGEQRVEELDQLLVGFADADRQFTEEIEPFMNRALATLRRIRDAAQGGRFDEAKVEQEQFAEEYRAEVQRLKATIRDMSKVGESLLTRL